MGGRNGEKIKVFSVYMFVCVLNLRQKCVFRVVAKVLPRCCQSVIGDDVRESFECFQRA